MHKSTLRRLLCCDACYAGRGVALINAAAESCSSHRPKHGMYTSLREGQRNTQTRMGMLLTQLQQRQ